MVVVWLIAFVVFLAIEVATVGLVSIWFCFGAFAAMIGATFHIDPILQLVLFFAVSIILLIATKPLVKKVLQKKMIPTNADRIIDGKGIVLEDIDNLKNSGTVKIDGKIWSARSKREKQTIRAGAEVTVLEIQGVKLIVETK